MSVEHHQDLADELTEAEHHRPGWPGPHPIDPATGNPIVGEVLPPEAWGKRYTPPSSTRRRLPRPPRSAGGNHATRDPLTPGALELLLDDRGNPVGRVDPEDGAIFTVAGNPSSPIVHKPRGGARINRRHTRARRAADALGIRRHRRVADWEHDQLTYVDGGRSRNVVQASIDRVARALQRAKP